MRRQQVRRFLGAFALALLSQSPGPSLAYEGATTLAGLTEQAALKSRLHRRMLERFALSLGLFEPLRLDPALIGDDKARSLLIRLLALDAGQGYAPEPLPRKAGQSFAPLRLHVLGWLAAGAVLEQSPAQRVRHHFADCKTGGGLSRPAGMTAGAARTEAVSQGLSSVRQLLAGAAMDGTGQSAMDWIESPENELGLATFLDAYERSVVAETAEARESSLVEALLAAGAMLSVIEQAGDPAYVHSDLSAVLAGDYSHYVAEQFGRAGIPEPDAKLDVPSPQRLRDLIFDGKGNGLAERTGRFLSSGMISSSVLPAGTKLVGPGGYLSTPAAKHWLLWGQPPRLSDGEWPAPRFVLDERCFADYATALLPEVGRYAQAGLDFLLRGDLRIAMQGETQLQIKLLDEPLGSGVVTLIGEKSSGERQVLKTLSTLPSRPGVLGLVPLGDVSIKDYARLVVLWKGRDRQGQSLVSSAQVALHKTDAVAPAAATTTEAASE
ncbi:MAG TPA: hypothetical protein PKW11_10425 [Pseudomonadota bacterium]|nr:hypothetical protein [Pseudomonadota bacterium]